MFEAYRDFDRFHGQTREEFLGWLRKLLEHNVADFRRRYRGVSKRHVGNEVSAGGGRVSTDPLLDLSAQELSPSRLVIAREQDEALRRALDRLPPDYRKVVVYRYEDELSFDEIGRRMHRTANAVQKLWVRAIERLQPQLGDSP
jgi:RNA polymerase sigma-70 factor (ECF subfamily)